jgi:hypothetical protein
MDKLVLGARWRVKGDGKSAVCGAGMCGEYMALLNEHSAGENYASARAISEIRCSATLHSNCVYLFERDCSVPAPGGKPAWIGESAQRPGNWRCGGPARAVDYHQHSRIHR